MSTISLPDLVSHRIILLRNNGSEVLVESQRTGLLLPCLSIPSPNRSAESLRVALQKKWGLQAICLFPLEGACPAGESTPTRYQVMDLCCSAELSAQYRWMSLGKLEQRCFLAQPDYLALERAREKCAKGEDCFSRFGWLAELQAWIGEVIRPLGLELSRAFQQWNASETFSLIRFETNGPAVWFKAVAEPNLRELAITRCLSLISPNHVAQMLGVRQECNGWLSLEANGLNLTQFTCSTEWQTAASALAELQIDSIEHRQELLHSGARNLTVSVLLGLVVPFFAAMNEIMDKQSAAAPAALGTNEIIVLRDQVRDSLKSLAALNVPEALGHLDLNPGNIVVSNNACIFLDWAEAYVGHPFFSLEYLLAHCRRGVGPQSDFEARVKAAYASAWRNRLSSQDTDEALKLVPLIAVFAYAIAISGAPGEQRTQNPNREAYLRALVRRMKREADCLREEEALCHSRG